jgi:hypothetical protein
MKDTLNRTYAQQLQRELQEIRKTLLKDLDHDDDDTTTAHLAVVAMNALVAARAEVKRLKAEKWSFTG